MSFGRRKIVAACELSKPFDLCKEPVSIFGVDAIIRRNVRPSPGEVIQPTNRQECLNKNGGIFVSASATAELLHFVLHLRLTDVTMMVDESAIGVRGFPIDGVKAVVEEKLKDEIGQR